MARECAEEGEGEPKRRRLLADLPGARLPPPAAAPPPPPLPTSAAAAAAAQNDASDDDDDDASAAALLISDVEAALLLLRDQLYGQPLQQLLQQQHQQQQRNRQRQRAVTSAKQEAASRAAARARELAALPPLVLRPQLHSVLRDRTSADREVERLRAGGRVRVLRFPGAGPGADEDALMAEADYRACVQRAVEAAERAAAEARGARAQQAGGAAAAEAGGAAAASSSAAELQKAAAADAEARLWSLRAFEARVVPSAEGREAAPRRAAVLALLAGWDGGEGGGGGDRPRPTPDAMLTHLMAAGVLARDPSVSEAAAATGAFEGGGGSTGHGQGPGGRAAHERRMQRAADAHAAGAPAAAALLLTVPGAGPVARSAPAGRAALLALLRARPHGEMPERDVLRAGAGRMRGSALPTAFHVRDAIGRGLVRRAEGVPGGGAAVLALVAD